MPKRHNCLGLSSEKTPQSACKSITFKIEHHEDAHVIHDADLEELNALRIECSNKSETICDLEKHVQDLKTQVIERLKIFFSPDCIILDC